MVVIFQVADSSYESDVDGVSQHLDFDFYQNGVDVVNALIFRDTYAASEFQHKVQNGHQSLPL